MITMLKKMMDINTKLPSFANSYLSLFHNNENIVTRLAWLQYS